MSAERPTTFEVRELIDRKIVGVLRFLAKSAKDKPLTWEDFEHLANVIERST